MKGKLIRVTPSCWSDDKGRDKSGYSFYIDTQSRGFSIDENTVNGKFFAQHYKEMMSKNIEFSSDEWGYNVRFKKQFKDLFKNG